MASLTQFFASRDFTQTHPPVITSSDCEGAGEVFTVAPANHSPDAEANESFFRSSKYLTVSTQLHLEALAQSVGNVWTLAPTFRAEKSDTSRHLAEFYMLEAEMTFVDDMGGVMDLAEDMLRHLSTSLFDTQVAQELFTRSPHLGSDLVPAEDVKQRWEGLMQPSWPRITYTEAINTLNKKADTFDFRPVWGNGLQAEHERYIAQHVGGGKPVFVTDYPRDIKAFYMKQQPDSGVVDQAPAGSAPGPTVECFDLLVPELCEIAGGSMREHRLPNLLEAMRRHGIATPPSLDTTGSNPSVSSITGTGETTTEPSSDSTLDWYVDLRRWGCPPHGGFGIGFDRLLCYLSGVRTIRDVVAFPRWFGRCDC
jgi:asparaginyl-tRNA synthetase